MQFMAKMVLSAANSCSVSGCTGTVTGTLNLEWRFGFPDGEVGSIAGFEFPMDDEHLEMFRDGNLWPMQLTVAGVTMKPGKPRPRGPADRQNP